jgi:RNA polymerase sigma factor (sigma-70 family)
VDILNLVKKAKKGDKDALLELILAQKQDYYKLAYLYLQNKEDALDAMEEMIIIVYERIYHLRKESAFYSWSKTILVNCCKRILKNKRKIISLDMIEEQVARCEFQQKEDQILLERCLSQLSEKRQEVIRLRYFLDLDYETISRILKIPLGTIKSRIFNALKKMEACFGGEVYEKN